MKRVTLKDATKLVGQKNFLGKEKMIDYYLRLPGGDEFYAFSRKYTNHTYELCKSGILVNSLMEKKSKDLCVMRLVNHTIRMMPYLADCYALAIA